MWISDGKINTVVSYHFNSTKTIQNFIIIILASDEFR